jgi:integrase/recombinase XerD
VYYLQRQDNIDEKKNRTIETKKEYERELVQFIDYLLRYAQQIDLDIDQVKEGSFFKSLSKRHLRRYQQWLVSSSPYVMEKGHYSPATIARKTVILKSFFLSYIKPNTSRYPFMMHFYQPPSEKMIDPIEI